jgi:hypothetical protein
VRELVQKLARRAAQARAMEEDARFGVDHSMARAHGWLSSAIQTFVAQHGIRERSAEAYRREMRETKRRLDAVRANGTRRRP